MARRCIDVNTTLHKRHVLTGICLHISTGHEAEYFVVFLGQEIQDELAISDTIKYEVVVTNPGTTTAEVTFYAISGIQNGFSVPPNSKVKSMTFTQVGNATQELLGVTACALATACGVSYHLAELQRIDL